MKIIVNGYNVNEAVHSGVCNGYDTPGCGSYCNCLCAGDH